MEEAVRYLDIVLEPWKWSGRVLVGGTPELFAAYVKRHTGETPEVGKASCGHAFVHAGMPWFLWLESKEDVAALAHEALHIASGVLEGRGMLHTAASEECYCYTMESIIRKVLGRKGWRTCR